MVVASRFDQISITLEISRWSGSCEKRAAIHHPLLSKLGRWRDPVELKKNCFKNRPCNSLEIQRI